MKKSLILVGMLAIGYANAQEGNVGINTEEPKATLEIQPSTENLSGTTNEGIIAPRLSKTRIANIEVSKLTEGTLVYATDDISSPISAYTGNDVKVAKITEKGYYFYNGTEWVKVQYDAIASSEGSKWVNDTTNNTVKLTNLSDGATVRENIKNIIITDEGNVGIGQVPDSRYRLDVLDTSRFRNILLSGWITNKFSHPVIHQIGNSTINSSILFNQMWSGEHNNFVIQSNDGGASYGGQFYFRANDGQLGFRLTTNKLENGESIPTTSLQRFLLIDGANKNVRIGNVANTLQTNQRSLIVEHENGTLGIYQINGNKENEELGKIDLGVRLGGLYETVASIKVINERDSYIASGKAHQLGGALTFSTAKVMNDLVNDQSTPEEHMRISSIGNVGMGTTTPTNKLHIVSDKDPLRLQGLQDGTGSALVVDADGVVKMGSSIAVNGVQNITNMECNEENRGKMNFGRVNINGTDTDAMGFCMKNGKDQFRWYYIYGGAAHTVGTNTIFGTGL